MNSSNQNGSASDLGSGRSPLVSQRGAKPESSPLRYFTFFNYEDVFVNGVNDKFFFSCDINAGASKKYGSCPTADQFLSIYNSIPNGGRKNFYEMLKHDLPRFEYYDIDCIKDDPTRCYSMLKPENYFDLFVRVRNSVLEKFGINPAKYPCEWIVSDSSKRMDDGKFKYSFHVINRKMIFQNLQETHAWYTAFAKYMKKNVDYDDIIDTTVCSKNRLMRLLNSSKFGQNRPLKPAEWHSSRNAPIHKFLITNVKEADFKNPSNLIFGQVPEIAIQLAEEKAEKEKALLASREARNKRAPDEGANESLFFQMLDALNDGRFEDYNSCIRLIWLAHKLELSRDQIHQLSSKATNYCEDWTDNIIDQYDDVKCNLTEATLHEFLMQDNMERYKELVPKEKRIQGRAIDLEPILNPDEVIDTNNIGSYLPRFQAKSCIAIRSNMMTFKTQNMKELFEDPNTSVAIVSFRTSLDKAYLSTFEEYGFQLYSDIEKTNGRLMAHRLVVQIDSLHLVEGKFDYLILDEIVSTMKHMIDFVREKSYVFEALKNYVRNCPRVLACDALMNNSIITFLNRLRNDDVYVIDNQFKSFKNRSYQIMDTVKSSYVIMDIIDCIERDLKVIVPTNSKKFADKLYARLTVDYQRKDGTKPKVGLITVDTDTIPVEEWTEYDLLIYTPKIVAGNSFNEVHFDKLIAYGTNRSCDANYFSQMLFRPRNLKPQDNGEIFKMKIYIKTTPSFLPVLSKPLHKYIKRQDDPAYKTGLTIDNYHQRIVKNDYYDLYANCLKIKHQSQNNFIGMLKGILNHHGLTEIEGDPSGIDLKEERSHLFDQIHQQEDEERFQKACFEQFNLEIATQVCSSTDIDQSVYEILKRKYDLTLEERRQVQKHIFKTTFNHPQLTPEIFLELNDKRKQFKNAEELHQNRENVEKFIKDNIQAYGESRTGVETIDRLTSHPILNRYCKLYHILKIYKAYGFEGPFDTQTIRSIPYEDLRRFIVDNFKRIETSFGLAINKNKLKEFQQLDISSKKGRTRISQYLNDKLTQMLGNCGRVSQTCKGKGKERYAINGIKEYYESLGVHFYEPRSVRFLKNQNDQQSEEEEINWDEVEEVQLVFED